MDIVASAMHHRGNVIWFENNGSQSFTTHIIADDALGTESVFAVDMDSDGDIDVLSASSYDDEINWYENDGSETFTLRTISSSADGARSV